METSKARNRTRSSENLPIRGRQRWLQREGPSRKSRSGQNDRASTSDAAETDLAWQLRGKSPSKPLCSIRIYDFDSESHIVCFRRTRHNEFATESLRPKPCLLATHTTLSRSTEGMGIGRMAWWMHTIRTCRNRFEPRSDQPDCNINQGRRKSSSRGKSARAHLQDLVSVRNYKVIFAIVPRSRRTRKHGTVSVGSLEQFEAGKHRQEVLLVRKIVAAGLPVPTDEKDSATRKRAICSSLFLEGFAWI